MNRNHSEIRITFIYIYTDKGVHDEFYPLKNARSFQCVFMIWFKIEHIHIFMFVYIVTERVYIYGTHSPVSC